MAQQINLFDASLRPPRYWITPLRLLLALLLMLGLQAAAALWLRHDAARWQQQVQAQDDALRAVAKSAPGALGLDAELPLLRQQLAQAQMLLQARQAQGPTEPPAQVLAALAAAAPGDVWITAAQWQAEPRQLSLEGELLDPRRLPGYLRRLEAQPVFAGQGFAQLLLEPGAEGSGRPHRFALRSLAKEGPR
jgi:hypothetical protein